jgi:hypothetical protein
MTTAQIFNSSHPEHVRCSTLPQDISLLSVLPPFDGTLTDNK